MGQPADPQARLIFVRGGSTGAAVKFIRSLDDRYFPVSDRRVRLRLGHRMTVRLDADTAQEAKERVRDALPDDRYTVQAKPLS